MIQAHGERLVNRIAEKGEGAALIRKAPDPALIAVGAMSRWYAFVRDAHERDANKRIKALPGVHTKRGFRGTGKLLFFAE